ncbi:MAG TPA: hypothetical protein VFM29_05935 [Vicinamibacteria bacterium]|nr:hypothetical protein [Vicinamibacteria bacterium]
MLITAVLAALLAAQGEARPRVYTNEDLDRVHPTAGQTGGTSVAAATPDARPSDTGTAPRSPAPRAGEARRGEAYWRREKERLEDRLVLLRDQVEDLRDRIADRERQRGVRPVSDPQLIALRRRVATLQDRIRDLQGRFEDRARREGALPGWLR